MRIVLTSLLLVAACKPATPTWHADVAPIVSGRCVSCHTEGAVAPFSLETYALAAPRSAVLAAAVEGGIMPPWGASDEVAYANHRGLTEEQVATIVAWVEGGSPEGDPADAGEPLPPIGTTLDRVDQVLEMPEAYAPTGDDDYRCFVLDWEEPETTFVTGFAPAPGNTAVVHHVAAFLIRPDSLVGEDVFTQLDTWDAEDEGPGYTCFGGPGGSSDLQVPVQQLAQWVPGGGAIRLAEGTGVEVPPGSKVVMQVHYHVDETTAGQSDQTRIDLQLADSVERKGGFAPWLDGLWPMGGMPIPAGQRTVHEKVADPRAFFDLMTDLDLEQGFVVHSAMLHMHRVGASATTWIDRADGTRAPILTIERYDFDWQLTYELAEPLVFQNGDVLGVSCTFDNTKPGAADIDWGEGTEEEMCVSNLYISEP